MLGPSIYDLLQEKVRGQQKLHMPSAESQYLWVSKAIISNYNLLLISNLMHVKIVTFL